MMKGNPSRLQGSLNARSTGEPSQQTGKEVRQAARLQQLRSQTSGIAPGFVQANLIALPSKYAADFRLLCRRNPVPCPLLAESRHAGAWSELKSRTPGIAEDCIANDLDLRNDFPKYNVYRNGRLAKSQCLDVESYWTQDHVGFLIGCSYSFETALEVNGLVPAHVAQGRNVPMYRTSLPLCPAGVFSQAAYVVSMRPYSIKDLETVRNITRPFVNTHGEPVAWGWDAVGKLGIKDISKPDFGDSPVTVDGHSLCKGIGTRDDELIPVFWGCGVTPQDAVLSAQLDGVVIGHVPGHMLVLDITDDDMVTLI